MDAIALAQDYQQGLTNPVLELEKSIAKMQSAQNVFISTSIDRAYREAKASAERWKNNAPLSIFDGVAIAWKDLFDVAGMVTTAGSKVLQQKAHVAEKDADLVAALTRMGMVNIGKTNLTEFAYSGLGLNPHFGTPSNIIDSNRIPGGSSSGSAIAVGLDIVKIAMGTDTAGSIRIPSAFNGLTGYRSSCHRYSKNGVFPLSNSLDTLGPLTQSVRDCVAIDCLLQGQAFLEIPPSNTVSHLNFYVDLELLNDAVISPIVKENFLKTIQSLQEAGANIHYKNISAFHEVLAIIDQGRWLGSAEAFTVHEDLLNSDAAAQLDPRVRKRLETARPVLASTQIKLYQSAERLRKLINEELKGGFLLTPTVAHVAPLYEPLVQDDDLFIQTNARTLRLTMPGSFLDLPCLSLPNGTDEQGLPTGVMVSGACKQDSQVLNAALCIEELLKGLTAK